MGERPIVVALVIIGFIVLGWYVAKYTGERKPIKANIAPIMKELNTELSELKAELEEVNSNIRATGAEKRQALIERKRQILSLIHNFLGCKVTETVDEVRIRCVRG